MSDIHENIKLTRQDIRSLENEQKELKSELAQMKTKYTPNYSTERQRVADRLENVGMQLDRKQAVLDKLLNKTQLDLFTA